jgi:hypothetical protein
MKTHAQVDGELNRKFSGVCSKILDAILREFNEDHLNNFGAKLATMPESKPFGFGFKP